MMHKLSLADGGFIQLLCQENEEFQIAHSMLLKVTQYMVKHGFNGAIKVKNEDIKKENASKRAEYRRTHPLNPILPKEQLIPEWKSVKYPCDTRTESILTMYDSYCIAMLGPNEVVTYDLCLDHLMAIFNEKIAHAKKMKSK